MKKKWPHELFIEAVFLVIENKRTEAFHLPTCLCLSMYVSMYVCIYFSILTLSSLAIPTLSSLLSDGFLSPKNGVFGLGFLCLYFMFGQPPLHDFDLFLLFLLSSSCKCTVPVCCYSLSGRTPLTLLPQSFTLFYCYRRYKCILQ